MIRFLIPLIAVVLFLLEPEFALFSPIELGDNLLFLIPRFLILYLIFIAIYYSRKRAVYYGLVFGILYDVFYVDIIGLYSFLYPLICFIAGSTVKFIHQHLITTTIISVLLVAILETVLYYFFLLINFTSITFTVFLTTRLIPTVIANLLFIIILGWVFKLVINARMKERVRNIL